MSQSEWSPKGIAYIYIYIRKGGKGVSYYVNSIHSDRALSLLIILCVLSRIQPAAFSLSSFLLSRSHLSRLCIARAAATFLEGGVSVESKRYGQISQR